MSIQKPNVRKAGTGTIRIELVPNKVVAKHEDEISEILAVLDHPEGLVTDESVVGDFCTDGEGLKRLKTACGKAFGLHAKMVDVAEAMRKHNKATRKTDKRRGNTYDRG